MEIEEKEETCGEKIMLAISQQWHMETLVAIWVNPEPLAIVQVFPFKGQYVPLMCV